MRPERSGIMPHAKLVQEYLDPRSQARLKEVLTSRGRAGEIITKQMIELSQELNCATHLLMFEFKGGYVPGESSRLYRPPMSRKWPVPRRIFYNEMFGDLRRRIVRLGVEKAFPFELDGTIRKDLIIYKNILRRVQCVEVLFKSMKGCSKVNLGKLLRYSISTYCSLPIVFTTKGILTAYPHMWERLLESLDPQLLILYCVALFLVSEASRNFEEDGKRHFLEKALEAGLTGDEANRIYALNPYTTPFFTQINGCTDRVCLRIKQLIKRTGGLCVSGLERIQNRIFGNIRIRFF